MSHKRRLLTLQEKINILDVYEKERLSVRDLAKRFHIGKTQSAHIIKNRSALVSKWHSNVNVNEKRRFLRPEGLRVDSLTFDWFKNARSKGIPLSGEFNRQTNKIMIVCNTYPVLGPIVQAKAKEISQKLGHPNFNASSGWLQKFRKRHNIAFKAISGEAASVNPDDVETFLKKVPTLIKNYSARDVFNADETGLFFRAIPSKSLALKNEKCVGGKMSKERVTILLCANMAGEKEKILMIGKAKKPRAFKNIVIDDLPVTWKSNRKAWMTSLLMEEWLTDFDQRMGRENRKILLFLDNACSHPKNIKLRNINVAFLPPNCTSVVQPLDQGVIKNFKVFYKSNLINKLLSEIDSADNLDNVTKTVNLLDAVYFANNAWQKVTSDTIQNCFRKAGIQGGNDEEEVSGERIKRNEEEWDVEDEIPLAMFADLWRKCRQRGIGDLSEYFNVDNFLFTEDTLDVSILPADIENSMECVELSDDSDINCQDIDTTKIGNYRQALTAVHDLQEFAKIEGDATAISILSNLELHFQENLTKKKSRQTTISEYFTTGE